MYVINQNLKTDYSLLDVKNGKPIAAIDYEAWVTKELGEAFSAYRVKLLFDKNFVHIFIYLLNDLSASKSFYWNLDFPILFKTHHTSR